MISVIQNDDKYEIRFRYDPDVIDLIKQVPGRRWDPENRMWTVPKDKLGFLLNQFKGTIYESAVKIESDEQLNQNETLDATAVIPEINLEKIPFYVKEGSSPYPHQLDFMKYAIDRQQRGKRSGFILADEPGLGKALTLDTVIPTPCGDKFLSDIHPGDYVFDRTGNPTKVLREYYHDSLNMYKVTFSDDTHVTCCEDHLWQINHSGRSYVASTADILSGNFRRRKDHRYEITSCSIPKCEAVDYPEIELPLDPWLIGFLIGDGSLSNQSCVSFTCYYPDVVAEVRRTLPEGYKLSNVNNHDFNIVKDNPSGSLRTLGKQVLCVEDNLYFDSIAQASKHYNYDIRHTTTTRSHFCKVLDKHFVIVDPSYYSNTILNTLADLDLLGCKSRDKFIPKTYKYNSVTVRIAVLQGLMDSDGYADSSNGHSYSTMSRQLAEDVCWLVRSLGGLAYIKEGRAAYHGKQFGTSYDVRIKVDDPTILYRASTKKLRATVQKFKPRKNFKSIEYVGKLPGKCIAVDNAERLYLCKDFIVTHNTIEVMNLALYNRKQYGFKHCLIICCINSSRFNWKRDIELHSNGEEVPYILGSRLKRNGEIRYDGSEAKYQDLVTGKMYGDSEDDLPYFIIVNIEALRYRVKKQHLITAQLISLINSGYINMIAIDEIHKNTSASSDQGKQLAEIHKKITLPIQWIPMTGTPITNKPTDVYLPLRLVGGHTFTSYFMWCRQFCVYGGYGDHEIIGYKNIPQLKDMLQRNMLRRLKKDVLKLPPKIQFTEYIELSPTQSKLYEKLLQDAVNSKDEIAQSLNPLSRLMKLRQVTGSPELIDEDILLDAKYISKNAKLLRLLELLEEIHERGEKVVIFSNWVEPLRTLYRYIAKKYNVCTFTGTMSLDAREENKRRFQTDPNYTVLLGTIGAAGTTHTFTAATNVIFFDECWTPADKEQAEDRCYRIGTDSFVNIYTLIAMNTVDERVHDILYTKKGVSQYIVDNKLDIRNNPKLLDIILEDGSLKLRR